MNSDKQKNKERRALSPHWRLLLQVVGIVLVPIGVVGIVLPVLPGVPVLILAAACFARSSPRLEHWLVTHPVLGPDITAWREHGAIAPKAKSLALSMMAISSVFLTLSPAPVVIKILVLAGMFGGAAFVATRPNH